MIKNIFDIGDIPWGQNSEDGSAVSWSCGVNTDEYMGEYGQKDFPDVEIGKRLMPVSLPRMAEAAGRLIMSVGMRRNIAGWALYVMRLWTG